MGDAGAKRLPGSPSFTALENVEGPPPPGSQAVEDLQQEINAQSLEKVQQYYRKLRYVCGLHVGDGLLDTDEDESLVCKAPLRSRVQRRAKRPFLSTYCVPGPLPT